MIQKRYQKYTKEGIQWTSWFDFKEGNSLEGLEKWQFGKKLKNEYRIV